MLKDYLGQLVKAGYLKEFVVDLGDRDTRQGAQQRRNLPLHPLGVIEIIHATLRDAAMAGSREVLIVAPMGNCLGE